MGRSRKLVILIICAAIVSLAAVFIWTAGGDTTAPRTVTASRREVVQDVAFTGRLASQVKADLSFEVAGPLIERLVEVGDAVEEGQVIARIDTTTAQLEAAKAGADQAAAEEETYRAWQKARQEKENTAAESDRLVAKKRQAVRDAKTELDQDREIFQQTATESGDNSSTTSTAHGLTLAAESKWHAAQDDLAQTLKTVEKSNQTARDAAEVAEAQYLATKQAAPNVAGLSSLQASEALARHKVSRGILTAPFSGVITAMGPEVGEYLSAGATAATVETTTALELLATVPETDAVKVTVGLPATVTFDAFSLTEQWSASVTRISPAAEIVEGVPTYEIELSLDDTKDQRLRPGLTANITVHAARQELVIAVPRRAIISRGTEQLVRILEADGRITEQPVTTGLIGSDGAIEVTSGLAEGQQIITSAPAEE